MNNAVHTLLRQPLIWRGGKASDAVKAVPSGFSELDSVLPGGGWPEAALSEILHDTPGIGELRLLMPALARLSRGDRWIALIAPPRIPYAPALAACGIDLSHVLLVHPRRGRDTLWAAEQALRSGTCAAVLCWPDKADDQQLRRLQLAAEAGNALGLLFRPGSTAATPSPAALRLHLHPGPEGGLLLDVLKCRGGCRPQRLSLDPDRPRVRALPIPTDHGPARHAGNRVRVPRAPRPRGREHLPQLQLPLDGERPRGPRTPRQPEKLR